MYRSLFSSVRFSSGPFCFLLISSVLIWSVLVPSDPLCCLLTCSPVLISFDLLCSLLSSIDRFRYLLIILISSDPFCSLIFWSVLFSSDLIYSLLKRPVPFWPVLISSDPLYSLLIRSVPFCSVLFRSVFVFSVLFPLVRVSSPLVYFLLSVPSFSILFSSYPICFLLICCVLV